MGEASSTSAGQIGTFRRDLL